MALEAGDILHHRYRILSILGQGGMGSVYHAIDLTLDVEVAIKENLFGSSEYAEQFKQEARLLASLRHPNLPRVTDYFIIENQGQYLVMDYIEGEDLKTRIEREGKISVEEATTIGIALCDALEYLHSQRPPVIHRDIKPGNVRITPEGHVFLVDFGLAKVGGQDQRTVTGAQAVTPGFSAPEQYGTSHTGPRSDIYSLGATLYMALSGEAPPDAFERALDQAELQPLTEINPEVPPALAQIIETALALQAGERFRSAAEMKAALLSLNLVADQKQHLQDHDWVVTPPPAIHQWRSTVEETAEAEEEPPEASEPPPPPPPPPEDNSPSTAPAPPPRGRRRRLWRMILWALILLALAGWYRLSPTTFFQTWAEVGARSKTWVMPYAQRWLPQFFPAATTAPSPTHAAIITTAPTRIPSPTATTPPTASPTATTHPTATPTPTATASPSPRPSATAANGGNAGQPAATVTPTPAATPVGGSGQIAFASTRSGEAQIWLADSQGNILQQLTSRPGGACQPAWTPDGQALAFTAPCKGNASTYPQAQIYLLHLDTGNIEELIPPDIGGYDPTFSPDGRYMAFTSLRDGTQRIYLLDRNNGSISPLTPAGSAQPAFSPDGRHIAFVMLEHARIWILPFDPTTGAAGEAQPFSHSGSRRNSHPTWAGDGALIIFGQRDEEGGLPYLAKASVAQNGLRESPIVVVGLAMREPQASPDGRWLAFEGWRNPNHDIYLIPVDGSQVTRLTQDPSTEFDPAWRPRLP